MIAESHKIIRLVEFGYTPNEAVDQTRKTMRVVDPNVSRMKRETIELATKELDIENYLVNDLFDNAIGHEGAVVEGKRLFKDLVAQYGDPEVAKDMLKIRVAKRFPISKINGRKEVMQNAPEQYYTRQDLKLMKSDIKTFTKSITQALGTEPKVRPFMPFQNELKIGSDGAKIVRKEEREPIIHFKDREGLQRSVRVGIKPIPNVTNRGSNSSRSFMLIDLDTNQPILKSDISPNSNVQSPLVYSFDLTSQPRYIERQRSIDELYTKYKETRDIHNTFSKELDKRILDLSKKRNLDLSQINDLEGELEGIRDVYHDVDNKLNIQDVQELIFGDQDVN